MYQINSLGDYSLHGEKQGDEFRSVAMLFANLWIYFLSWKNSLVISDIFIE